MAVLTIASVKSQFETGDKPTQADFASLIDTLDNVITYVEAYVSAASTDHTAGIQAAYDAAGSGSIVRFQPGKSYTVSSPIRVSGQRIHTIARGAVITGTHDGVLFDLAPDTSQSDAATDQQRNGNSFHGGVYRNSNTTKSASIAFRAWNQRGISFIDCEFGNTSGVSAAGFWRSIETYGRDTFTFDRCFFNYGDQHVVIPPVSAAAGSLTTQLLRFNNCSFFPNSADDGGTVENFFRAESRVADIEFNVCNFSLGNEAYSAHSMILLRSDTTAANASFKSTTRNIAFNNCKMEATSPTFNAAAPSYFLNVLSTTAAQPVRNISINNFKAVGMGTGGSVLNFQRTENIRIYNVEASIGDGQPWTFDASCKSVRIGGVQFTGSVTKASYANIPRHEYTLEPEVRYLVSGNVLTGFDMATPQDTTTINSFDVAANLTNYPSDGDPKGYWVTIVARDVTSVSAAASALATAAFVDVYRDATVSANARLRNNLSGVPNDERRAVAGYVVAAASGKVGINISATNDNALDTHITVNAIHM